MAFSKWFQVLVLSVVIFSYSAISLKQKAKEHQNNKVPEKIKVLAAVLPPFTYFNSSHGFYDGIDVRILDTIAKRFHLKLVYTKADNLTRITVPKLR